MEPTRLEPSREQSKAERSGGEWSKVPSQRSSAHLMTTIFGVIKFTWFFVIRKMRKLDVAKIKRYKASSMDGRI